MWAATLFIAFLSCSNIHALDAGFWPDRGNINSVDRMFMFPYSGVLDSASDYTQYAAFLMPAFFALAAPSTDWMELGFLYAGSAFLSYGTGSLLKILVPKDRPYMYYKNPPQGFIDSGDYKTSFPSDHTIMAFTGAAFVSTVFQFRYPESPYKMPVIVASYTLALATAALRVRSGSHFLSDVAVGALIGSFSGFIVPWLNFTLKKKDVTGVVTPYQASVTFNY